MDNKNKWLPFAPPTTEELKALKKLIKVEPLLLSKSITEETEYRVYYNDEKNNLQYLYVGNDALEKQKELIQSLKNSPDFKEMVQEIVKDYVQELFGDLNTESLPDFDTIELGDEVVPNPEWNNDETSFYNLLLDRQDILAQEEFKNKNISESLPTNEEVRAARAVYRNNYLISNNLSSQYNYYFDCGNGSKGSFACLWKNKGEYFILTAAHNLLKNGTIDETSIYKLVSPKYNETIFLQYNADGWKSLDWARLKLVKKNPDSKNPEWIPCTDTEVEATDFYKNCIKFSNIEDGVQHQGRETKEKEQFGDYIVAYNATIKNNSKQEVVSYKSCTEDNSFEKPKNDKFWSITELGHPGNSGGAFFNKSQELLGLYIGTAKDSNSEMGRIRNIS